MLLEGKDAGEWLVCCSGASQGPTTYSATEAVSHPHSEERIQVGTVLRNHVLGTKTESRILGRQVVHLRDHGEVLGVPDLDDGQLWVAPGVLPFCPCLSLQKPLQEPWKKGPGSAT